MKRFIESELSFWITYAATLLMATGIYWISGQYELFSEAVFAPHDAFYPVTAATLDGSLALFNSANNFSKNFVSFYLHIPDRVFISIFTLLGVKFTSIQLIHTLTCYFLFISGSFYSFSRITSSRSLLILVTLAYGFSPVMAVFYSAGIFYSLSTVFSLAVIPIFVMALTGLDQKKNIWIVCASIFIFAYNLMFFMPALILLFCCAVFQYRAIKKNAIDQVPWFFWVGILLSALPMVLFIWMNSRVPEVQSWAANSAGSAIKGSIIYPLMQIASWGIYNDWHPRAILNFSDYFFTPQYKFLSIALVLFLISYLAQSKNYLIIFLLIICAFFAKGEDIPFGFVHQWVVDKIPFGQMIRTPDNKFGAFIPAIILLALMGLPKIQLRVLSCILFLFISFNIFGLYFGGALSASHSGQSSSSYVYDQEYSKIAKLINGYPDAVVLNPYEVCSGLYTDGKFHTCNDLVLSSISRQVIPKNQLDFSTWLKQYSSFETILYINKLKPQYTRLSAEAGGFKALAEYEVIYETSSYLILRKPSSAPTCGEGVSYSCIKQQSDYLYSLPWYYYNYVFDRKSATQSDALVASPSLMHANTKYEPILLECLYMLGLLINAALILHLNRQKKGI